MTTQDEQTTKVHILITHDEMSLHASLHRTRDEAIEELRGYLNDNEVGYQDPLPDDASREEIEEAADDRSQFAWEIVEQSLPA